MLEYYVTASVFSRGQFEMTLGLYARVCMCMCVCVCVTLLLSSGDNLADFFLSNLDIFSNVISSIAEYY